MELIPERREPKRLAGRVLDRRGQAIALPDQLALLSEQRIEPVAAPFHNGGCSTAKKDRKYPSPAQPRRRDAIVNVTAPSDSRQKRNLLTVSEPLSPSSRQILATQNYRS